MTDQTTAALRRTRLGLDDPVRASSVANLDQLLADTISLRDLYKKHHGQTSSPTFQQPHLLFDKHYGERNEITDATAERIMTLGRKGVPAAGDVTALIRIERAPKAVEGPIEPLRRLLDAHGLIATSARVAAHEAAAAGDYGTNDLMVSQMVRVNEARRCCVTEHLFPMEAVC